MAVAEGAAVAEVVDRTVVGIMRSSLRSRIRKVSTSSSTSLRSINWCTRDTRNHCHKFILLTIIMIRIMVGVEVEEAEEESRERKAAVGISSGQMSSQLEAKKEESFSYASVMDTKLEVWANL